MTMWPKMIVIVLRIMIVDAYQGASDHEEEKVSELNRKT